jgi:PAS domain S-box-containing protein
VVENHSVMLGFMSSLLEERGHIVKTANDGLSALDVLGSWMPDIMFVDLVMPNISGDKLCRIVSNDQQLDSIDTVILSGLASEYELDFRALGASACIAKGPFETMSDHVDFVLDRLAAGDRDELARGTLGADKLQSRQMTQELLSSRQHLEGILENLAEGILELTTDGDVVLVNRVAARLIGQPEERLLGTRVHELFAATDRGLVQQLLVPDGADQAGWRACEVTVNDRVLSLRAIPVLDQRMNRFLVVLEDITVSLRQRKERAALEEQLHQAQKMEAIGQLASGVAHDFNNQLAVILGIAEMLGKELEDPQQRESAEMIARAAQRSADLTRQLLTFARKIDHKTEPLDIHTSIREVTTLLGRSLDKRIVITKDLQAASHIILGDRTQIENALFNLALNARDAMPEGGQLRFSTEVVKIDLEWLSSRPYQLAQGLYLSVLVTDTGTGMDEGIRLRVFEPFFTTKQQGEGTGMGLAAVYGTVKSHGGAIEVASTPGQGSVFSVYLPLADPQAAEAAESEIKVGSCQGANILVVDDEEQVCKMLTKMLTRLGHQVVSCSDGMDAIDYYRQSWHQVDLVILDLVMPRLGGRDAYLKMREINPDIRILLTTGTSSHREARQLLSEGVTSILEKPYRMATLKESLASIL